MRSLQLNWPHKPVSGKMRITQVLGTHTVFSHFSIPIVGTHLTTEVRI